MRAITFAFSVAGRWTGTLAQAWATQVAPAAFCWAYSKEIGDSGAEFIRNSTLFALPFQHLVLLLTACWHFGNPFIQMKRGSWGLFYQLLLKQPVYQSTSEFASLN